MPAIAIDPARVPFGALAPMLAGFLTWLHAFPVADLAHVGVDTHDIGALVEEVRAEALDDFELVSTIASDAPLDQWHAYLTAGPGVQAAPSLPAVLLHNDLAAEHILLDPQTHGVTGIIDWSDMAIGDRIVDFAGVFHWGGEPLVRHVLSIYDNAFDKSLIPYARFLAACRGVGDVASGLETGRRAYIDAGLRALHLCATNLEATRAQ